VLIKLIKPTLMAWAKETHCPLTLEAQVPHGGVSWTGSFWGPRETICPRTLSLMCTRPSSPCIFLLSFLYACLCAQMEPSDQDFNQNESGSS
jgi:hypothetical protein